MSWVKLDCSKNTVTEPRDQILRIGRVRQVAGHQWRKSVRRDFNRLLNTTPIFNRLFCCRDRRNKIGHHNGPTEMFRSEVDYSFENFTVAEMHMPIVWATYCQRCHATPPAEANQYISSTPRIKSSIA